jgi:hypothetical protein
LFGLIKDAVSTERLDSSGLGYGSVAGFREYGNEHSSSRNGKELADYLSLLASEGGLCSMELNQFEMNNRSGLCDFELHVINLLMPNGTYMYQLH